MSGLVRGLASRLHSKLPRGCGIELSDLIQAGNVGLLKAERTFNPGAGIPLAGYAKYRIRGEMLDMIRRHASRQFVLAPNREDGADVDSGEWLERASGPADASPHCSALRTERDAILHEEIGRLPERYRRVVSLRYSGELTLREIGDALRVNESRACQIHRLALIRLRQALSSRGVRTISHVI